MTQRTSILHTDFTMKMSSALKAKNFSTATKSTMCSKEEEHEPISSALLPKCQIHSAWILMTLSDGDCPNIPICDVKPCLHFCTNFPHCLHFCTGSGWCRNAKKGKCHVCECLLNSPSVPGPAVFLPSDT